MGVNKMNKQKKRVAKRCLLVMMSAMMIMAFSGVSVMAAERADIAEGYYYIKAANGNANGQVLYWNEDYEDQNICMMFESSGGKHADNEVWFIRKNRNFDDYYGIYLARTYYGDEYCNRLEIDNLTGRDQPYLMTTKGPHVFCGPYGNQDDAFVFMNEKGDGSYTNLTMWSHDDGYKLNRHKEVKVFKSDLIYINANKDSDNNNKLWELIPVNYVRNLGRTAPAVTAQKGGKLKIGWDKLRNKFKDSEVWQNAEYIEIQYSTDKAFLKNVKTKTIKKGTFDKESAKSKLSKLKIKKTYYIRARLIDKDGVASNWSKTAEIRTKK